MTAGMDQAVIGLINTITGVIVPWIQVSNKAASIVVKMLTIYDRKFRKEDDR